MGSSTEFLIVGSGIAGASLACALTRAGAADVLVVEAEATGSYHASRRSAAMYMASYGNSPVRALTRRSLPFFLAPPDDFVDAPLLHRRGHLTVADETGLEQLRQVSERSGAHPISTTEARTMVPALREDQIAAAILDPEAADIDTDLLYQSYVRAARRAGAKFRHGARFAGAERRGGRWLARVGGEAVEASCVICAAGAWADEVAQACGVEPIGLAPLRRTALLVSPPASWAIRDWPMVMTVGETLYFKPDAGKLLVSPADETPSAPCDAGADEWDVALAVDRLERLVDIAVRRVDHSWAGLRTFAPDRTPVVGFDPASPRFFWFAGQGGYGFQLAPALAAAGAAILTGTPSPGFGDADAARIAPDRLRDGRGSSAA